MVRTRQPAKNQLSFSFNIDKARKQGGRTIAVATATIETILKAFPPISQDEYGLMADHQRPIDALHIKNIAASCTSDPNAVFGTLVFTGREDAFNIENAEIDFQDLTANTLSILDGQHRVQAFHVATDEMRGSAYSKNVSAETFLQQSIGIQFIQNTGDQDTRDLFVSLNKGKAVNAVVLAYMQNDNPFASAVKTALKDLPWLNPHVELGQRFATGNNRHLISLTSLAGAAVNLKVGIGRNADKAARKQVRSDEGQAILIEQFKAWANWLRDARVEYDETDENTDFGLTRFASYACHWQFINLTADLFQRTVDAGKDTGQLQEIVRSMNLNIPDINNNMRELELITYARWTPVRNSAWADASGKLRRRMG